MNIPISSITELPFLLREDDGDIESLAYSIDDNYNNPALKLNKILSTLFSSSKSRVNKHE